MVWKVKLGRAEEFPPALPGVLIADTKARCLEALAIIESQPVVGVDVEAYGCDPRKESPVYTAQPISIQFAGSEGPRIFVPLWSGSGDHIVPDGRRDLLDVFGPWMAYETKQKVLHNAKFDKHTLKNWGFDLNGLLGDTLVMDYLFANGEQLHGLKECLRRYGKRFDIELSPYESEDFHDYGETFRTPRLGKKDGRELKTTWIPPLTEVVKTLEGVTKLIRYAVKDPFGTVKLYQFLKDKLSKTSWTKRGSYFDYYEQFELDFTQCLWEIEREGCPVDVPFLEDVLVRIREDKEQLERDFFKECVKLGVEPSYLMGDGTKKKPPFNMLSGPQVADLLFRKLGVAAEFGTKGGKEATSTEALEAIKGRVKPIALMILKNRKLDKLDGTYVGKWIELAKRYRGRIHTTLKQTGTATMRLSSAAPNLQNVTKPGEKDPYNIREAFVSDSENTVVGDIDLSQIEVRLSAHFTGDPKLIELLEKDGDQHLLTMTLMYDEAKDFVADRFCSKILAKEAAETIGKDRYEDMRRAAKVVNFGSIYGMGPQGYAAKVGCSVDEGKVALKKFWKGYSVMDQGIRKTKQYCYQKGHVRTILRRYCVIPGIRSDVPKIRGHAERQAFNYVIQGSARDLLMMGMLLCWRDRRLRVMGVRMILQIHDELVFLIPKRCVEEAKKIIEEYVQRPYGYFGMNPLVVETPADLGVGPNWLEAKKAA